MPNSILTPTVIANEALAILRNQTVFADLVHTDYSSEFTKVGDTITVRTPATLTAADFTGSASSQTLTEGSVTVKLDKFKDVSVDITSKESSLSLRDFSKQVIEPAMVALAQAVDVDIANHIFGAAGNAVAIASATPTTLADIANAAKALDIAKAPIPDRHLVLSPTHKYRYALTTNLSAVNYAGSNETLRDALLGKVYTLNTYMDQNVPASTATTSGTAVGTITVASSSDAGEVDLTVGSAATATFKIGDGFVYLGKLYRFTENVTLVDSAKASMKVSPAFPADITATPCAIVRGSNSVAFHRNGVALVTRQLDLPMGAARAAIANDGKLAVRVVYGYSQTTKTDTISFDILYGIATLRSTLLVRLADAF
ncbi:MAG TPA: P22 phage major capsid protein family protein [Paludibacteraceae bacterium]|nr:P22 phage major capsid protein family protein [Paludibacteraceae bacterium]